MNIHEAATICADIRLSRKERTKLEAQYLKDFKPFERQQFYALVMIEQNKQRREIAEREK